MAIQAQMYSENLGFPFGGSQEWLDNACGLNEFCLNLQQQNQPAQGLQNQQLQQNTQRNQNLCYDRIVLHPKAAVNIHQPLALYECLGAQIEKQRLEIDQFITLQNEGLRLALQEQRKQQIALLLKKYETKTEFLLKQKDEDMSKAMSRAMELEESLKRMEMENQVWQRIAREKEAIVMSLNDTIEKLRESVCMSTNGADDAESCCDMPPNNTAAAVGNEHLQGNDQQITSKMICKSCNYRRSCVILLPCRHLCSCKACEAFLHFCPVCKMVKKATIEALI